MREVMRCDAFVHLHNTDTSSDIADRKKLERHTNSSEMKVHVNTQTVYQRLEGGRIRPSGSDWHADS